MEAFKLLLPELTRQELHERLTEYEDRARDILERVSLIEEEMLRRNATHILVLDIETTGFLTQGGKIVEIGIVDLDLNDGSVNDVFHSICREEGMTAKDRDAWIFSNSSLKIEDVRNAPLLEDLKHDIQMLFDDYQVTAFNRNFDIPFLESRGFQFKRLAPCPMLVACEVMQLPNMKWPKVTEAMPYFFPGEEYNEEHRGLQDARDEARIVYELFKRGVYKV